MKAYKTILVLLIVLLTSGCMTTQGTANGANKNGKPTLFQVYSNKDNNTEENVKARFGIKEDIGHVKPYVPVITQPTVKKVWIPPHKSDQDKDVMIDGHWVYVKLDDFKWFVEEGKKDEMEIPVIVPTFPSSGR